MTGTDHELATLAARARSLNGAQAAAARTLSSTTGFSVAAASPTGPPARPQGSIDQAESSASGRPSEAAQASVSPVRRWMHSRSLLSAAPSADRISDRLDDGSAETRRSTRPCSRLSWRRADESTCWPDTSATTSSGCTRSGSVSWQASTIVVPRCRSPAISSSTWADSVAPSSLRRATTSPGRTTRSTPSSARSGP
jgi:hypothetical protein